MERLTELAEEVGQVGHWQEAERMIASISDAAEQAWALAKLAEELVQAGHWQEAERMITSISGAAEQAWAFPDPVKRWGALARLAEAVGRAGHWQEAERMIASISDAAEQTWALRNLADTLLEHNEHEHMLSLLHRRWRQADTREEAICLLPLSFGLIPLHPSIGLAFYDAFAWVDNFLRGEGNSESK